MLEITGQTTKKDLLNSLAGLASIQGSLLIHLHELPNFLATPIAFTIFNYQIGNYPRKIIWTSDKPVILEFLKDSQVDYLDPDTYNKPQDELLGGQLVTRKSQNSPDFKRYKDDDTIIEAEIKEIKLDEQFEATVSKYSHKQNQPVEDKPVFINPKTSAPSQTLDPLSDKRVPLSAQDLLKQDTYKPSLLIDSFENTPIMPVVAAEASAPNIEETATEAAIESPFHVSKISKQPSQQNLDSWLDRIEATRAALNKNSYRSYAQKQRQMWMTRVAQFTSLSIGLTLIISFFAFVFPTNVYSLEIKNMQKQDVAPITIAKSDLIKTDEAVETTVSSEPTGVETGTLINARGIATIVNRSGGSVAFDKQGIILRAENNQEFRHVGKASEPGTFRIPARSNVNGGSVNIEIEAVTAGEAGQLPVGSTLRIYNLRRDLIGGLLVGEVTQAVSLVRPTGNKIVTEADVDSLSERANQQIGVIAGQKVLQASEQTGKIVDPEWYEIGRVDYQPSQIEGEQTPKIDLKATSTISIYSLDENTLKSKILETNPKIKEFISVDDIAKEDFEFDVDTRFTLNVQYSYIEQNELSREDLIDILATTQDFEAAKSELQNTYPEIDNIEKSQAGVHFPGIPARVSLEIQEQN